MMPTTDFPGGEGELTGSDHHLTHAHSQQDEEEALDVSDVVNLEGLDELVKSEIGIKGNARAQALHDNEDHSIDHDKEIKLDTKGKRKRPFLEEEEMDFQQWTNGFLSDAINQSNDDIDVDYYGNDHRSKMTKRQLVQSQEDFVNEAILNELNYERSNGTNDEDEQNLAVQAVSQAVSQAVAAVQQQVEHSVNNEDAVNADIAAAVAAAEEAVMNGLLPPQLNKNEGNGSTHSNNNKHNTNNGNGSGTNSIVSSTMRHIDSSTDKDSSKRSERHLFELIQKAINNENKISKDADVKLNTGVARSELIGIKDHLEALHDIEANKESSRDNGGNEKKGSSKKMYNDSSKNLSGSSGMGSTITKKITKIKTKPVLASEEDDTKLLEAIRQASEQIPAETRETPGRSFSKEEKTAIDVFVQKYQSVEKITNEEFLDRIWSSDRKRDRFWVNLQKVLPHRTRPSLYKHVRRTYHVFSKRGIWTSEEDSQLKKLTDLYEGKWKFIGEQMKRMPEDCRDRWRNYLKCGQERNTNKWSTDEEELLKKIISEMGGYVNWTRVSELMQGKRSRIQCRYKWNKLMKRDSREKIQQMDLATKIRLLEIITKADDQQPEINWDAIATELGQDWNALDVSQCYEMVARQVADDPSTSGNRDTTGSKSHVDIARDALALYTLT